MRLYNNDKWCKADKGKIFVLTEKGKNECASYNHKTVGKPVDEYEDESPLWAVEKGYVEEVKDPDWIICNGYKVVYNHNGNELCVGNPMIFFDKEIAEKYAVGYSRRYSWHKEKNYVIDAVYEGKKPKPCREYNGKRVYNRDYWNYVIADIGDLVEEEIVDDAINAVPPACMRSSCMQCGEPTDHKIDKNGKYRATYETFKKVTDGIYEYCGDCFVGENIQTGTEIPLVY